MRIVVLIAVLLLVGCTQQSPYIHHVNVSTIDVEDNQDAGGVTATLYDGQETYTLERIAVTKHYAVFVVPEHLRERYGKYKIILKDGEGNTNEKWIVTENGVCNKKGATQNKN